MNLTARRWAVLAWLPAFLLIPVAAFLMNGWSELPARMATHFNAQGVPNGWSSKQDFLLVMLPMVFVPVLLGYLAYRIGISRRLAGAFMLMTHYFTAMVLSYAVIDTVRYNLTHVARPVGLLMFAFAVPVMIAALLIGIDWRWWFSSRKEEVAASPVIATERHGGRVWLWVSLPIAIVLLVVDLFVPGPWKAIPLIVAGALVATAAWAWWGFEYRFTKAYVEVRMPGIRLRRIPLQEVTKYEPQDCSPLVDFGGWGIKGFGNETAYIWGGRRVLRIETPRGTVYLGHEHPERLVKDMEVAMSRV